ncbi:MAG: hypothetical protein ACPGU7_01125 [Gammaproteobacteria bacterium]
MKELDQLARGQKNIEGSKRQGGQTLHIWSKFKAVCESAGYDTEDGYPFNGADRGRNAIRNYCNQILKKSLAKEASVRFGTQVGRVAALGSHGSNSKNSELILPYEKVQFDGHPVDIQLVVKLLDSYGNVQILELSRIWLLVIIDVSSSAILGYSVSVKQNYDTEDFLDCVASAFAPWHSKELPTDRLFYKPGAGLPSGVVAGCDWRCFNSIQLDNAYVHISGWLQRKLIECGVHEVITNIPRSPRSNGVVERFFRTIEDGFFHRLPNTFGANPQDPRRNNPGRHARALEMTWDDLLVILDLVVANMNVEPTTRLGGQTPNAYLAKMNEDPRVFIRKVPKELRETFPLYERDYDVTIRGGGRSAHTPYVTFQGAKYSSDWLLLHPELIGEKAKLKVNIKDLRAGVISILKGKSMGRVHAQGGWAQHPHTIGQRRAINHLIRKGYFSRDNGDLIRSYNDYLRERALKSRRERNKLLELSSKALVANDPRIVESPSSSMHLHKGRITITKSGIR